MALSRDEKSVLEGMLKGLAPGRSGTAFNALQLLQEKGLVKKAFGHRGARSKRKRRGVIWDGRYQLVSEEEARAALAVEVLSEGQEPGGERAIFKGGEIKLSMAFKGFEMDPSAIIAFQKAWDSDPRKP